jgi:histidinol-phosphate aminotransferase
MSRAYEKVPEYGAGLRLHLNENTAGCSPVVLDAMRRVTREACAFYPDYSEVHAAAARWIGVAPDQIALTNGLDEGIHAASFAYLQRGDDGSRRRAVIMQPAFDMYAACAELAHAEIVDVAPRPGFAFPLDALKGAITLATRVVFLTSPNNPTGVAIARDELVEVLAVVPSEGIVFLDEAYVDFAEESALDLIGAFPQLVIGRTFAKAQGLAAVRAGAVIASEATMARLRRYLPPYGLNIFALTAIVAAAGNDDYVAWYRDQVSASRALVYEACTRLGRSYTPSQANFVLVQVGGDVPAIVRAMADRGIFVRDRSTQPGCAGCIRIGAGVVEHTTRALAALEEVLCAAR